MTEAEFAVIEALTENVFIAIENNDPGADALIDALEREVAMIGLPVKREVRRSLK